MQFLNGLVALVFAGVVAALATPSDVTLSDRAEDVVPSHLTRPSTFYRAITAGELPHVAANYPIGHPPTRHGTSGALRIKSFTEDNVEWATFVENSYKDIAHTYDIVEGPYSTEVKKTKVGAIGSDGKMVWQAAFIGPRALATLRVKEVKKVNTPGVGGKLWCSIA
ncbi:hypothetical protein ONZ45_g6421 [Pleurotus djamor]|nr:hypothetical protein ONZ45_g6421 [Pleurotus djamor]